MPLRAHPVINRGAVQASLAPSTSPVKPGFDCELIHSTISVIGQECLASVPPPSKGIESIPSEVADRTFHAPHLGSHHIAG